ncbi:PC-esterase domain-containing protein 1A-like, partial [Crotalus adamanteus]
MPGCLALGTPRPSPPPPGSTWSLPGPAPRPDSIVLLHRPLRSSGRIRLEGPGGKQRKARATRLCLLAGRASGEGREGGGSSAPRTGTPTEARRSNSAGENLSPRWDPSSGFAMKKVRYRLAEIHDFTSEEVQQLLHNKFVVVIGDSNYRAIYTDLVYLLQTDEMLTEAQLRRKDKET